MPAGSPDTAAVVSVRGMKTYHVPPVLAAFDAAGNQLRFQLLQSNKFRYSAQLLGLTPRAAYYLRLTNPTDGTDATGNYRLGVDLGQPQGMTLDRLSPGQLDARTSSATGILSTLTAAAGTVPHTSAAPVPAEMALAFGGAEAVFFNNAALTVGTLTGANGCRRAGSRTPCSPWPSTMSPARRPSTRGRSRSPTRPPSPASPTSA